MAFLDFMFQDTPDKGKELSNLGKGVLGAGAGGVGAGLSSAGPGGGKGGFSDFFFGTPSGEKNVSRFTPQQEASLDQLLGGASQQLPQIFSLLQGLISQSPESMKQFEAPFLRQFQQETLPTIAERFTGMNAQKSSAFGQQLGQAGASLQENLASQRGNLQFKALDTLQNLLGSGLRDRFDTVALEAQPGALQSVGEVLLKLAPMLLTL